MFHRKNLGLVLSVVGFAFGTSGCTGGGGSSEYEEQTGEAASAIGETWSDGHTLGTARSGHSVTRLKTGGQMLVVGGTSGSAELASVELCHAGQCRATDALETARTEHMAVLLEDGRVLVAGGKVGSTSLDSVEIFDPATEEWDDTGEWMNSPRSEATITRLSSGKVLVAGGIGAGGTALDTAEIFDPADDSWTTCVNPMKSKRKQHAAARAGSGKVLIAGGYFNSGPLASAEIFDPGSDPVNGTFTLTTGSLATARSGATATKLSNGKVLVAGGLGPNGALKSAEVFDLATGTFSGTGNDMVGARRRHVAVDLADAQAVLLLGGMLGNGDALATAERYDEGTNLWSTSFPSMGTARKSFDAVATSDGRVWAVGGTDGTTTLASTRIWSPDYALDAGLTSILPAVGGTTTFTESCDPGYVAVGLSGYHGSYYGHFDVLFRLTLHCRELLPNGTLGALDDTATRGTGGSTSFDATCEDGKILFMQKIGRGTFINRLEAACAPFDKLAMGSAPTSPEWLSVVNGTGTPVSEECPAGYAITGFHGIHGDVFDRLGFVCTKVVMGEP